MSLPSTLASTRPSDADLAGLSVLLIDDMALVRQELRNQLGQLGASNVTQCSSPDDAIDKLQRQPFDLVLCDYNLQRHTDGQQMLEYLRAHRILGPATVFVMVTAEQEYVSVAAAAEVLPDDYILKPFTTKALGERLRVLLTRQVAFKAVNQRMAKKDYAGAAALCAELAGPASKFQIHALRRKAECHLEIAQHAEARAVYEQLLAIRSDLSWARIGLARCLRTAGRTDEARSAAQALVESNPQFMQAYDLLADLAEEKGDDAMALSILQRSAEVVPSARRSRRLGDVAYRAGDLACAREHYAKVHKLTRGSKTAEPGDALQLAQVHLDEGNAKAAMAVLSDPEVAYRARTGGRSQATATGALEVRALAQSGNHAAAAEKLKGLMAGAEAPRSDMTTLMLAKANMAVGHLDEATEILSAAVRADHDNKKIVGLVRSAIAESELKGKMAQVVDGEIDKTLSMVKHAEALMRQLNHDGAVKCIETALDATPDNTVVLLAASQITLIWLSKQTAFNRGVADKIEAYLSRLDRLLPGSPRIALQHKFFRETVAKLTAPKSS